ncbi:MAG: MarR family transcriptional regulator [Succinivibrio sp.]
MKSEILQKFLLRALEARPKELEAEFLVSHGVAVRAVKKLQKLGLYSREAIESIPAKELHQKWYKKSPKFLKEGDNTGYLEPDFALMQHLYITARANIKTRSDKKTAPNRNLIIEETYLSEENRAKAAAGEFKLYSLSHVYKKWSAYSQNDVDEECHKIHEYGDSAELDFNGPQMEYTNEKGEVVKTTMIGIVLPASVTVKYSALSLTS